MVDNWSGVGTIKERGRPRIKEKRQICGENQGFGYVESKLPRVLWTELAHLSPKFIFKALTPKVWYLQLGPLGDNQV